MHTYATWYRSVLELPAALDSFCKPGARTPSSAKHRTRPAAVLACPQHRTTVGYRAHVCHRLWNAGSEVRLNFHAVPNLEHVLSRFPDAWQQLFSNAIAHTKKTRRSFVSAPCLAARLYVCARTFTLTRTFTRQSAVCLLCSMTPREGSAENEEHG